MRLNVKLSTMSFVFMGTEQMKLETQLRDNLKHCRKLFEGNYLGRAPSFQREAIHQHMCNGELSSDKAELEQVFGEWTEI
jgi:hypothetical protein